MARMDPKDVRYETAVKNLLENNNEISIKKAIEDFYKGIADDVNSCETRALQEFEDAKKKGTSQKPKRSQQGEHVINKSILKIHEDIINEIMKQLRDNVNNAIKTKLEAALNAHLRLDTDFEQAGITFIQATKSHFDDNEFYYDTNAALYKAFLTLLRQCAVKYFQCLGCEKWSHLREDGLKALQETCETMIANEIYVDYRALDKFKLNATRGQNAEYESAKNMVAKMLRHLEEQIRKAVEEYRR